MLYLVKEKTPLPKSQLRLEIEIPVEEIQARQKDALARAQKELELPGFRKGHAPEEIIRSRIGELALFEEAALGALPAALNEIFLSEKIEAIGRPEVIPTKLVPQNPAVFQITVSLIPTLSLPDYKKIAAEHNQKPEETQSADEKEIDSVIEEIIKQRRQATGKKEFVLADDTVKELGDSTTVAAFREKVKEGLLSHKKTRSLEKRRAELLDILIKNTVGDIPDILVASELDRMEAELKSEIERIGGSFEQYLSEIKKDSETVKKEWRIDAEKRARLELLLLHIARAENIAVQRDAVEREVVRILKHNKNIPRDAAQNFVENMLAKHKVLEFLENLK